MIMSTKKTAKKVAKKTFKKAPAKVAVATKKATKKKPIRKSRKVSRVDRDDDDEIVVCPCGVRYTKSQVIDTLDYLKDRCDSDPRVAIHVLFRSMVQLVMVSGRSPNDFREWLSEHLDVFVMVREEEEKEVTVQKPFVFARGGDA